MVDLDEVEDGMLLLLLQVNPSTRSEPASLGSAFERARSASELAAERVGSW